MNGTFPVSDALEGLEMMLRRYSTILVISLANICSVAGLAFAPKQSGAPSTPSNAEMSRRAVFASTAAALLVPAVANARLVLNEDGEYEEIEEGDWQSAWKERLEKAQSMSPDEVFMAARGAGNVNLKEGPESDASKKRRAMAGCRDVGLREKAGVKDAKECTARVLSGENDFMLNVM